MTNFSIPTLTSRAALERELQLKRELSLRYAVKDCWYWLRNCTKTEDEQNSENPLKPFPDRAYFQYILDVLNHEPVVFIEKSRTMLLTWILSGYLSHLMFTRPFTTVIVQSKDEARSLKPIQYAKALWRNSEPELKDRWLLPRDIAKQPYNKLEVANGSWMVGLSGDVDRIRSDHPIVLFDEAAFIPTSENMDVAVAARPKQIIANSSACPGWFHQATVGAKPCNWPEYKEGSGLWKR